jgi:hypothetical protein
VLWGLWHTPIVDDLGTAGPHGAAWLPFFLAFVALVTAFRVLLAWVYCNTDSLPLVQLMHASFTGGLAVLSPATVSPRQEAFWYAVYAGVIAVAAALVVARFGPSLVGQSGPVTAARPSRESRGREITPCSETRPARKLPDGETGAGIVSVPAHPLPTDRLNPAFNSVAGRLARLMLRWRLS